MHTTLCLFDTMPSDVCMPHYILAFQCKSHSPSVDRDLQSPCILPIVSVTFTGCVLCSVASTDIDHRHSPYTVLPVCCPNVNHFPSLPPIPNNFPLLPPYPVCLIIIYEVAIRSSCLQAFSPSEIRKRFRPWVIQCLCAHQALYPPGT